MRSVPVMLSVFLALLISSHSAVASEAHSPLSVDTQVVDLGQLAYGEKAIASFQLTNDSEEPVLIRVISTSCSCVTLDLETPRTLAAGESIEVRTQVSASGQYGQNARELIAVYLGGSDIPIDLFAEYAVTREMWIEDASAAFSDGRLIVETTLASNADLEGKHIRVHGSEELEREQVTASSLRIKFAVTPLYNGKFPRRVFFVDNEGSSVPLELLLHDDRFEFPDKVVFEPEHVRASPSFLRLARLELKNGRVVQIFLPVRGLTSPLELSSKSQRLTFEQLSMTDTANGTIVSIAVNARPGSRLSSARTTLTISSDQVHAVLDVLANITAPNSDAS